MGDSLRIVFHIYLFDLTFTKEVNNMGSHQCEKNSRVMQRMMLEEDRRIEELDKKFNNGEVCALPHTSENQLGRYFKDQTV